MIATIDSFIKIFKFYQDNELVQYFLDRGKGLTGVADGIYDRKNGKKVIDLKTGKYKRISLDEIFKKNHLRYDDTIDIYLNSLVLDKYTQLSYDTDSETIVTALNAREKMKKYFSEVFYPGSYAFTTTDNSSFRKMLLDWTSTIKTIQDSNKRLTDAYSLSSEDVDKALRGFGTSFINKDSLLSVNRRKNFLLNVCDLYSIKGTPQSIIKALNIIGLDNIFIREGWMFKDTEDGDIKIDWQPVKEKSSFNEITKQYENFDTDNQFITDWNWFDKKINQDAIHCDPHWMYTKSEILELNDDSEVYMKLPSITPYFGIEFITDADIQIDSMETVYYELDKQFKKYLTKTEKDSDYKYWLNEYDSKLSILQAYSGLIYSLIRLDDHLLYQNFRSFLSSCEIQNIPEFNGKYEYFQIIYWFYLNYKLSDKISRKSQFNLINSFIPIKSQDYCSYEQVLRWWLSCDYDINESKKIKPIYIYPDKLNDAVGFIELGWTAPFEYGRYGIQVYSEDRVSEECDGWLEIKSNEYSYQINMNMIVSSEDADGFGSDVNNFRIVYYHTPANLPDVFFKPPFNLNNQLQDTFLDRTVRYNGPSVCISHYNDNIIKNAFINQNIKNSSTKYDVISGYHRLETMSTKIRVTDIDTTMRSMYASYLNYPNLHRLYEDKWMNINNDFYNFVDWSIKDFTDTKRHEGLMYNNRNMIRSYKKVSVSKNIIGETIAFDILKNSNILYYKDTIITKEIYDKLIENDIESISIFIENNFRKYPVNSKWNWAVDTNYVYFCYESNKWCRVPCTIIDSNSVSLPVASISYGDKFLIDDKLYIYVSNNKVAKIDCETTWNVNDADILPSCNVVDPETKVSYWKGGRIKEGSELSRDLAIARITDSYILDLIYKDCTLSKNDKNRSNIMKVLKTEEIEVYQDPYGINRGETFNYEIFLTYLYNSRLILDFDTGYIYPNYQAVKCHRKLYFKSFVNNNDKIWVRIQPEFEWNDCKKDGIDAETIYKDWELARTVNDIDGKVIIDVDKDSSTNTGFLFPLYTLPNRYDSLRFLDGPVFDSIDDLQKASDKDQIDKSVNYVLIRTDKGPIVCRRVISMNDTYTNFTSKWERCLDNRIYDCNYGISPDLLEFIESRYAQGEQYYINIVNDFTDLINSYMTEELGITGALLDITIANWSTSGIVKKTVKFYKPKRVRLLFVSNKIEGDYGIGNNLDSIGIGDQEFNYYDLAQYRFGNPGFNKKNLNRMNRQKISHVINEYVPHSDTIMKLPDDHNQVYNSREIYDANSKIPSLEVYDQLLNLNQQVNGDIIASFYVSNLEIYGANGMIKDSRINGFYYKIPNEDLYSNNIYFFKKIPVLYAAVVKNKTKITTEYRWAIFRTDQSVFDHSTCIYVANKVTKEPYRDVSSKTDPTVKYAERDFEHHPKYIESLVYNKGEFVWQGSVKTNRRVLEPVFYISQFEKKNCNGFYYHDETLYPNRNDKPVYFNQHGKIISYTKPDWIIPDSYIDNTYDIDDNWRMSSDNEFYNNKTLIESVYIENGVKYNGYGFSSNRTTVFFLYWDKINYEWIFKDLVNKIRIVLVDSDGNKCDKKIAKCSFIINESQVNLERFQKTNRYWIVTDDRQIVEFKDADYFAYCYLNDELIWNPRNSDITKVFHSSKNSSEDTLTWGIKTSCLYNNEDLIDPQHGYIKILNDKYSLYRRNHFNAVELKNKPISYLYCYNGNIRNFYNDDNRIKIDTNSTTYSLDKEGNLKGSIEVHDIDGTYLRYTNEALNDKNEWSIAFRILAFDQQSIDHLISHSNTIKPNEWFMIIMTSNIDYDYYYKFAFDSVKNKSYSLIDDLIKNDDNLIYQIIKMKTLSIDNIIYNTFTIPLCDTVIGNRNYHYNVVKYFDSVTIYQEDILKRYSKEKLIEIRNSLAFEIKNHISSFDTVQIPKTEIILHKALILSDIVSDTKVLNCDYCDFYINGIKIRNNFDNSNFFNGLTKQELYLSNINVKVSEYGLWEYALSDWYCGVISSFRILRSRPEPQKSKTSLSKNNYRPLFVFQQPRIVYPIQHTALPENIKGDRFKPYNADPVNKGDIYVTEVNPLWRHERPYDENESLFVKDGAECQYKRKVVNDGKTLISDSDYRISPDELPYWWIRKESDYRTGPIYHKPLYIAIQEKINEIYPHIDYGIEDKVGNYHDIGIKFDGVRNRDTSFYDGKKIAVKTNKDKTYFDITFDPNSSFTSEYDKYVLTDYNNRNIIGYAKNKDPEFEEDYDKVSIYEIARNFYPIDNSDKVKKLRLRFIDLDNNGCTYDSSKIVDDNIIIPDIAQLTLTKEAMSNGIFHDNLKYYTNNSEFNYLCGIWTPCNNVKSYQDGDFNYCYKNSVNEMEAVLTYQRSSGYFWWEFRKLINSEWKTVARTYIQPKHNISKKIIWKDYVNWNQIDLAGQLICKFKETDYEDFATKDWHLVEQDMIDNNRRFACGSWIKFELQEVPKSYIDPATEREVYFDGKYLFFYDENSNKWFRSRKECETDWNDGIFDVTDTGSYIGEDNDVENNDKKLINNTFISNSQGINGKPKTPSGFLYRNGYLYFYVDIDNRWVRLAITNEISDDIKWSKYYKPWKFYKSKTRSFGYMNVINSTNSDCFDNCYVIPNNIDIIETYVKLIKYNGISDFDWSKHIGEDIKYPKSVNNDISLCRCSVKDSVYVYVYQINEDDTRTLLNELDASVIRTNKELVKPDQCWKRYNSSGKLIKDPDIKGYRSMWNFSDFPLYRKYGNDHISGDVWDDNTSSDL